MVEVHIVKGWAHLQYTCERSDAYEIARYKIASVANLSLVSLAACSCHWL
jgi:hypothetical protein